MVLLTIALVGALAGWMLGRDPTQLTGLVTVLGISQGALEGGMVAKRATFKKEAVDALHTAEAPAGGLQ
jgi:hypothetical protein